MTVHELSIASAIAGQVAEELGDDASLVRTIRVDVGRLSGIVTDALAYGWSFVKEGTPLAGADLEIAEVEVTIRCGPCGDVRGVGREGFVCSDCGTPSADFVSGRDLLVRSVVLVEDSSEAVGV